MLALSPAFYGEWKSQQVERGKMVAHPCQSLLWQTGPGHMGLGTCWPGGSSKLRLLPFPLGMGICTVQGMLQGRHGAVLLEPYFPPLPPWDLLEMLPESLHVASSLCLASSFFFGITFPLGERW